MTHDEMRAELARIAGIEPRLVGYYCKHPNRDAIVLSCGTKRECEQWLESLPVESPYKHYVITEDLRYHELDHNLCAEVRAKLTGEQRFEYVRHRLNAASAQNPLTTNEFWRLLTITPEQDAECIIKAWRGE